MANPIQFLKETRAELKHVTWPSRNRAILYAVIVIIFSAAIGYLLGGFDTLLHTGLKSIILK